MSTRAKKQTVESHRLKVRMARKMLSKDELKTKVKKTSIWDTKRWLEHVTAIKGRVYRINQRG